MYEKNAEAIKILIIEDSPADAFIVNEYLQEIEESSFEVEIAESLQEGEGLINTNDFDVVLIDLNLPDSRGVEHYKTIFKKYSYLPFIIMTGMSSLDISVNMIKQGARDYLVKGEFDAILLSRSISYVLERKSLEDNYIKMILNAQDKEKERIALDVHDSLGQYLTSASIQIQNLRSELKSILGDRYEEVSASVDIALDCLNESMQISRGISRSLMPKTVKKFGLESGIEGILITLADHPELNFKFESNLEDKRFDSNIELAYFRIAQEAINNVVKYSQASKALVELKYESEELSLCITDNGIGFDPYDKKNEGIGMESMRARAKAISARLEILSDNEDGSSIRIIKAIKNEQSEEDQIDSGR